MQSAVLPAFYDGIAMPAVIVSTPVHCQKPLQCRLNLMGKPSVTDGCFHHPVQLNAQDGSKCTAATSTPRARLRQEMLRQQHSNAGTYDCRPRASIEALLQVPSAAQTPHRTGATSTDGSCHGPYKCKQLHGISANLNSSTPGMALMS